MNGLWNPIPVLSFIALLGLGLMSLSDGRVGLGSACGYTTFRLRRAVADGKPPRGYRSTLSVAPRMDATGRP